MNKLTGNTLIPRRRMNSPLPARYTEPTLTGNGGFNRRRFIPSISLIRHSPSAIITRRGYNFPFRLFPSTFRLFPSAFFLLPFLLFTLNASISQILSPEPEPSFVERHRHLHSLPAEALHRHSESLLEFLSRPAVPPPAMEPNDFHSLRNDVADLLIAHDIAHAEHLRISIAAIADPDGDLIWRDYCIQKLPELLNTEGPADEDRRAASVLIDTLTADSASGLAGTTLITAMRLSRTPAADLAPTPGTLAERAIAIAGDETAPLPDRVTALQVAAIHQHPETARLALDFLADRSSSETTMLRVGAIAALGELGDASHREAIERYRLSADTRLRAAARTALARIDN